MKATIIRTDGREEEFEGSFDQIKDACGFQWAEVVNLKHCPNPIYRNKSMLVDEEGHVHGRARFNKTATKLYHSVCVRGTQATIVGDVAVVDSKEL